MRIVLVLSLAALLGACSTSTSTPEPAPAEPATPAAGGTQLAASVQVPRDGKQFDPPVAKTRMPEGAYFCDMGDVHYARMTPGDGDCPVCGMKLSHNTPAEPAPDEKVMGEGDAHEHADGEGHEHADGAEDHDHADGEGH